MATRTIIATPSVAGQTAAAAATTRSHRRYQRRHVAIPPPRSARAAVSGMLSSAFKGRAFHVLPRRPILPRLRVLASLRGFRKSCRGEAARKQAATRGKELELSAQIGIEEGLPDDPEVASIAEMLRLSVPMAMKISFDGLRNSSCKTCDTLIDNLGRFERAELSVLLCNDDFMQKLNKEWRGEDSATDVLSMSQHIPELDIPTLTLGDIVISVETATRQAVESGHTLLDEIRILVVHGLLHLLGFDHEISEEAEIEMEREEVLILRSLGWRGKGLIKSATDTVADEYPQDDVSNGAYAKDIKNKGSLRFYKPKFRYIFCDMDGTLLNSKSQITASNAEALKELISRGINIVIATGKTRPAVESVLKMANLAGLEITSQFSPGVFLQGLLVYGRQGREICRSNLDQNVCREAFQYSLEHQIPLVAFSQDQCFTLFDHPLVESLHAIYHEPKAEVLPSVEYLLSVAEMQKLLFFSTAASVSTILRPHWSEATKGRAGVIQAQADMLEIVPPGTSKGSGVKMLLDHLNVSAKEIMAIGDGENDVEMLQLAALGVALENGSEITKSVANVIGLSNDEDGVAHAIYKYAF